MNWLNAFGETIQTRPEALNGFGVAKDTELAKPSAFQGTGEALEKTLPFQFYQSVSGFNELLADRVEVNYDLDNNEDAFSDFQPTQDQKEQVANKLRQDAKFARLKAQNDYTPNPETTGQAAMMIHGLTGSLAKAVGYTVLTGGSGILAAPLFGADLGLYEAGKLRDKGVDESTARKAGAITGAVNAVGMALPGAVGTSYLKSMAFGGLVNPATDVSEQAAIKFVLENANYSKQAQEYDPFDPVNLGVSAGMGIAFGALGARANRAQARYLEAEQAAQAAVNSIQPSHVDAAMELQHANVIQNDQPVGKLGDVNKSIADERKAAEQIDNGERVEVTGEGVDPEAMDQQVSSFITRFVKELVGAGTEQKVAEMGAKVHDAFFETLGIRLGKSRKELEQEYALRVERGVGIENLEGFASMSPQDRLDILNRSREFDEQLRLWEQGEGSNKFNLGKPSWVLQIFGASDRKGVNTTKRQFVHVLLPKGTKLLGIDGKHGIQATELKGLLVGIQQPIAVFKSATDGGIVLITELKRGDSPIIVPIHLTQTKDGDFKIVNFVASTYEKERTSINKWVEKGLLLGYDKTKGPNVLPRDFGSNPHLSRSADVTKTSANDKTLNPSVRPIVYQNETSIGDLYQSESALRGIYTPGERVITLMQSADESTFIHESGHYFLDVLTDVAMKESAPAQVKADIQTLMNWFGVKDLEEWRSLPIDEQRAAHEKFARGFEQYLREGEAPSTALEKVFKAFKDWMTKIYKSSEELQVEISPEVRAVYDRLLATDEQIRAKHEEEAPTLDFAMKPDEPTNPAVKAVQQTAEQVIDAAPIPEEGKTQIREALGINQPEQQTGENHPRHKVMSDEEFVDNEFQKVLEDHPDLKIYDESGAEVGIASFMETANQKAQELRRTANSMGEAALCMWNQGGLENL